MKPSVAQSITVDSRSLLDTLPRECKYPYGRGYNHHGERKRNARGKRTVVRNLETLNLVLTLLYARDLSVMVHVSVCEKPRGETVLNGGLTEKQRGQIMTS